MLSRLGSHARRNLVAYLALFVALGGTAVAAKPLITGADVQDGSLTGADVENDSLTGSDVLESSLSGSAPSLGVAASNITGTLTDAQVSDTLTASSAADANSLGGVPASGYTRGEGRIVRHSELQGINFQSGHYGIAGWFTISHQCRAAPTDGLLVIINRASEPISMFVDDGGANPAYTELDGGGNGTFVYTSPTAASGDLYTLTVRHPDGRVATAHVSTVARGALNCLFQVQIVVANSEADN